MTEQITETLDNTAEITGQDEEQATSVEEVKEETTSSTEEKDVIQLTQDELNEIIRKRVDRERRKYSDYEDVKKQADEYAKAVEKAKREQMTEVERLEADLLEREEQLKAYREQTEKAQREAEQLRIRKEFDAKAREAGIKYLDDAYQLAVMGNDNVRYEDGEVIGLDDVIKDITESKPFLLSPARPIGKPMGQSDVQTGPSKADQLEALRKRALETGAAEDRVAYAKAKRQLGL